jgi:osmoprotectant transport system permease protein
MKREAVSLLGLAALLVSVALPYLTVKETRVAAGTEESLWSLLHNAPVALSVIVFAVLLVASSLMPGVRSLRERYVLRALVAGLLLPVLVAMLAALGDAALAGAGHRAGRVGPSIGWWLAAGGAYILLYDAARRARRRGDPAKRRTVTWVQAATAIVVVAVAWFVPLESLGVVQEYLNRGDRFWEQLGSHLVLSGASVGGAVLIGVPLGMLAFRSTRAEQPVFTVTSGLQTIPSLALFGLMIAPLAFLSRQVPVLRAMGLRGVGNAPAIIALVLYGLLPIVRNTYVGLRSIDRAVVDAGRGMGMSRVELLIMVQLPIALPIILTGLRITAVQTIGNAAVAALIGARGLGNLVFQGLGQAAPDLIVLGALPIVALAVVVDRGMDALITAVRPGAKQEAR